VDLRKIDALIAEHVMDRDVEWRYITEQHNDEEPIKWSVPMLDGWECPHYSTDISAAWEVVEKYKEYFCVSRVGDKKWMAVLTGDEWDEVKAGSAPLVICLAALKVEGIDASSEAP